MSFHSFVHSFIRFLVIYSIPVVRCTDLSGNVTKASADTLRNVYGTQVVVTCDIGHKFPDHSISLVTTCQADSTWDIPLPYECQRKRYE